MKKLIHEIHRRSLWQVLSIYLIGGWVALQAVDILQATLRLPEWTPSFALVLLVIGLPIVLATAFVQQGVGTEGPFAEPQAETAGGAPKSPGRFLTWRNATLVGVAAALLWGGVALGWFLFGRDATGGAPERDLRSVAVLPFASRSQEGDATVFADGVHDDLLTQLAKIPNLKVISRTSVLRYRGTEEPIHAIADELGVATVLEGSVDRVGDRVRVNVQLIDAQTDDHLWADSYDEELTAANIFAIRTDLARKVAGALRATLTPEVEARIESQPTDDLEAYTLYLRGRQFWNQRSQEGLETAEGYFRRAIERDSAYALAWAAMADTYALLSGYGYMPPDQALPKATAAADRALKLDPLLGEAHAARGLIALHESELELAEEQIRRAIELNPSYASAHHWYCIVLRARGRAHDALREIRRASELDPLSPIISETLAQQLWFVYQFGAALAHYESTIELDPGFAVAHRGRAQVLASLGLFAAAMEAAQRASELDPVSYADWLPARVLFLARDYEAAAVTLAAAGELDPWWSHQLLREIFVQQGRFTEALEEHRTWVDLDPDPGGVDSDPGGDPFRIVTLAHIYASAGDRDRALKLLDQALKLEDDPRWRTSLGWIAAVYGVLGNYDEAFQWLDRAFNVTSRSLINLKVHPRYDALRSDPRFQELLRKMGLE